MSIDGSVLNQFFLLRDGLPTALLLGSYQPWLVVLSIGVAALTSMLALQLAGMAARADGQRMRQLTLLSGSAAMGGGIWSMHFIGMLAFRLCQSISFDAGITLLSAVPALLASWVALSLLSRGSLSRWQWVWGGVLVGAGIGAMHYTGMAAMEMNVLLRYDPLWFAASIVVAVLLAMLALWIRFGLQDRVRPIIAIGLGGAVMGGAIAGMHYTAMAAARFVNVNGEPCADGLHQNEYLALVITFVTLTISVLTAGANGLLRYRSLSQRMRAEKRHMQAMLDTAVDGIVSINGEGVIQSFNGAAERLFGWQAAEVIGRNVKLLMPDPDRSRHDDYLKTHLDTGRTSIIGVGRDVMGLHKDGHHLPIRLAIGRVAKEGAPLFVAFVTDISERQKMEQALRDSEQQYRSLIANSPGVNFRCNIDADWSMVVLSDAMLLLTGWPAQDVIEGRIHFNMLIHPDDRDRVSAEVHAALAAGQHYVIEYRLIVRDGSERWVSETGRGTCNAEGHLQWIDGVIIDISEAKRLQRQLEDAKERAEAAATAKSAFLANMSHEIRTPMNAILGFTELLVDTPLSDTQRKHLDTVRGSARSLLGLLNDILDTAKLDKGAVELEQISFSLHAISEQVLNSLRLAAERKGLSLQLDYPDEAPRFFLGDPLRIQQVLLNLVGNAIKFTERGGVQLVMRMADQQIHLRVVDTGIGIAPDRLDDIFKPFAQADASTTRRFGGTGLGTTISRQLVERMGGRITVESQPGQGSCFHVWLPLPAGTPVQDDAVAASVGPALPHLRLLVADDVAQNGELLQLLLGRDGHHVRVVGDGEQALQALAEDAYDAVLMDVHMPKLDGLAATRRLRELELAEQRTRTPVIALTASVLEADRQAAMVAGMDGFATKPVEQQRLYAELARVLGMYPHVTDDNTQAQPASQHESPVLDIAHAERLWADTSAWRRALHRFGAEQADGRERLQALLDAGHWDEARALAHRWRGAAGSLALLRLQADAASLDEALRHDQHEQAQQHASRLLDTLRQSLAAIAALEAVNPALHPAKPTVPSADVPEALWQQLDEACQRGELNDAAVQQLLQLLGTAECAALVDALDQFDFESARQALRALRA